MNDRLFVIAGFANSCFWPISACSHPQFWNCFVTRDRKVAPITACRRRYDDGVSCFCIPVVLLQRPMGTFLYLSRKTGELSIGDFLEIMRQL